MPTPSSDSALVWFRRDLRCQDHAALSAALDAHARVWCVFVFDTALLDALADRHDRRVAFIHASVIELDERLREAGGYLQVVHGDPVALIPRMAAELGVSTVYANRDYEPLAVARDARVESALRADGRRFVAFKDQVIFERDEILTGQGTPYGVFTPYRRAWEKRLQPADSAERRVDPRGRLAPPAPMAVVPSLAAIGFEPVDLAAIGVVTGERGARQRLDEFRSRLGAYGEARDYPAIRGPSYLSVHLRFGTVSVRELVRTALAAIARSPGQAAGARVWLGELIWRDFYFQVLHHHPHVVERAFRPEFDRIVWESGARAEALFAAWCEGRTGYPLVDAAIAQILHSGYMHNRLRMVVASFLVKDLGIDWRWGERWFARHLIDFDLAANNGGWQWAASTGCDAQPWFRIFNPVTQSKKFDPRGQFIRRYRPALASLPDGAIHAPWLADAATLAKAGVVLGQDTPRPIVDHDEARQRTLARFGVVRRPGSPPDGDDAR